MTTKIRGKKRSIFGEDLLFLGLHLICSPEQNRGRGLSPPKLKIGQSWGKIANYPPNAQQRSASLTAPLFYRTTESRWSLYWHLHASLFKFCQDFSAKTFQLIFCFQLFVVPQYAISTFGRYAPYTLFSVYIHHIPYIVDAQ